MPPDKEHLRSRHLENLSGEMRTLRQCRDFAFPHRVSHDSSKWSSIVRISPSTVTGLEM
jgi:hypothetical protein